MKNRLTLPLTGAFFALFALVATFAAGPASAQVTAFKQAVAEASYGNEQVGAYYRSKNYQPLWTGDGPAFKARRAALFQSLESVSLHGLPDARYNTNALMAQMRDVRTTRDLGMVEVAISKMFVRYARDVQKGMLIPLEIDAGLVREVTYADNATYLAGMESSGDPQAYMRTLTPTSREYQALMKEKLRLEGVMRSGGWIGRVPSAKFELGTSGDEVVALRNRLINLGYMNVGASRSYDSALQDAVQRFQLAHGLESDGVAGQITIDELNKPASTRLKSVIVAMERERWLPSERGTRHVLVNLADFHSQIIDDGYVSFRTRSVIGKNNKEQASPEFSDVMEHMEINPSWYVPRSIILRDYLGKLQRNPGSVSYMRITDRQGRVVNRATADFSQYTRSNFPFALTQPPSNRNALGLVKFMFPNKYNIYLHDSPAKSLFNRESRAFSSGCIRLQDPFDFAYALLALQSDDPEQLFQSALATGKTVKIVLEQPVPVHLIYRTAFTTLKGGVEFRRDVYGRDAKIWNALNSAGVKLPTGVELASIQR
ncbi:MAG: L,D-transpeptidase family protein [Rhodobacteraceae bacterium]|nr:L,D-transpeptidase family protein [Paracoccaceae bacterium]